MGILNLPDRPLLLITENLSVKDLSHFLSTSRYLSSLLTPHLHTLALQDVCTLSAPRWAASYGHASLGSLASLFISKGAEVGKPDPKYHGRTPLHKAAELGYPDVIRVLVMHGAPIDAADDGLQTPLHMATVFQHPAAVRVLLELGADMTCTDKWGRSPARLAARIGGGIDCMRAFLDAGLDLTHKDSHGRTILHDAIMSRADMVNFLIVSGGWRIINAKDFIGRTPLRDSMFEMRVDMDGNISRLLRYHGADTR